MKNKKQIILKSDASYNPHTKVAGLAVVDQYGQTYHTKAIQNVKSSYIAETMALIFSIKLAVKKYSQKHLCFWFDCKSIQNNIKIMKKQFESSFESLQFVWMKRNHLDEADKQAKLARKKAETSNRILSDEEAIMFFRNYSTKNKINACLSIASPSQKDLIEGFLNNKNTRLIDSKIGKDKKLYKFIYKSLNIEDKKDFFNYLKKLDLEITIKPFRNFKSKEQIKILEEIVQK